MNHITPATFRFLGELARNNNRDWFNANKERYIEEVRDPLCAFVEAFAPKLAKISANLIADSRPNGGSLLRVYRDTRFSRDKRPYNSCAGISFRHIHGRDVAAPEIYLHIEPGSVFAASGMWHPPSESLTRIRDAIVDQPGRWKRLRRGLDEYDDMLKRAPHGYDPQHPFVEDLKSKNFTQTTDFTLKEACAPGFLNQFARSCKRAAPLMEFLADAVDVDLGLDAPDGGAGLLLGRRRWGRAAGAGDP